ncbi:transcription elongation factor B polypeptide 3 [Phlebotomus argentipes]|uniref:transcription elongation factor B polypeptide 3 n=1 Tax=Phlebotomus argentipes TaxID=94469 RepID=UPI002892EE94|nr:transcription elongation factor B polypeptide 3 [Phlebotomus argentipes]
MGSVKEIVEHYQKSIDKTRDKKRLLHCIEKLYKLPITIEHLQETGIGKTVNNLRKEEGEVKVAARALVAKWKAMVAQAELDSAANDDRESHRDSNSDHEPEPPAVEREEASAQVEEKEKSESGKKKEHHKSHKKSSHHRSHSHKSDHREHKREERHKDRSKEKVREHRHSSKKDAPEKPRKVKPAQSGDSDDSIDNSKGASFADVLSMIPDVPSRKSGQKRHKPTETPVKSTATTSTGDTEESSPKRKKSEVKVAVVRPLAPPEMLKSPEKLAPLDPEIIKGDNIELPQITMPQISNNYRPMPLNPAVMECVFPSSSKQKAPAATFHMTDEEAMGTSMQSKNQRTKVYSGVKTGAVMNVPTLHELCIRVLQRNIDALEYTGGVPFEILKPVIERATPEQLFTFEHYNPYLMEDTDELWQQHCKRRFKAEKRREMESWREMYLRCFDEQEARFNSLTQNIKQSLSTSVPVRKTQLAYVDSIVKPPRNVLRKQNQFGTRQKISATPAARVAALSGISKNAAKAGDARLRVAAANREYDPASSTSAVKPKRAPLMQKSLMLFKGRLKK